MRKTLALLLFCFHYCFAFSQGMSGKVFNFSSFSESKKVASPALEQRSSQTAKSHPEYGILPPDAQCSDCVELIDQRTMFSRQFIDAHHVGHTYSQQSYLPLHYPDQQGRWRTIDHRLRPVKGRSGIYAAMNQPLPVTFDLASHYTSITLRDFELVYNHNLSLYSISSPNDTANNSQQANYAHYIVGDDGCRINEMWSGIDLEAFAKKGQIETNFIILSKPLIPLSGGYLVIEDRVSLPAGYKIERSGKDLIVKSSSGKIVATMEHVRIHNRANEAIITDYVVTNKGNDYTIKMLVPYSFLDVSAGLYPIVVDPVVTGIDSAGAFQSSGLVSANMGFSTLPAHCDYHMTVQVPGMSQLVQAYIDIEDENSGNPGCDTAGGHGHICLKRETINTIVCDTCQRAYPLSCRGSGQCDTPGVLTTDPRYAGRVTVNYPAFLGCLPPQCPDYFMKFTLQNSDSNCHDLCGQLCSKCNEWKMTIEACRIDASMDAVPTTVCPGTAVTLSCHATCGVPPYHYLWSNGMTGQTITIYPQQDVTMSCTAYDTCDDPALTNDTLIHVTPAPAADAGTDRTLCGGGRVFIGGAPTTTSPTASITWTATPPSSQPRISNNAIANPIITTPTGIADTTLYQVKVIDRNCFRLDTMFVFSFANPVAAIDTSIYATSCGAHATVLHANGPFASYMWSDGASTQSDTISAAGQYAVIVTDVHGCEDTAGINTPLLPVSGPIIHAYPDTIIFYGDSVMLYTDANLSPPAIDSFFWLPEVAVSCPQCVHPVVVPQADQVYVLTAFSQGCLYTDSATVKVVPLPDHFYVPNAFSPNGDGINDSFIIYTQAGAKVHSFVVFDRWGEKVHDGTYAWDGTYRGVLCAPGVYVYIMSVGIAGQAKDETLKGSVTLIR